MFNRVSYASSLPSGLTTHQLMFVSRNIHRVVSESLVHHLDSKPQYLAVKMMLDAVEKAMGRLGQGHTRRKYKNPRNMRAVGGANGCTGEKAISNQKRAAYDRRRSLMQRLRVVVRWRLEDLRLNKESPAYQAAERLNELINKRIDHFERDSYQESAIEFAYFFKSVDAANMSEGLKSMEAFNLYQQLKVAHDEYRLLHDEQIRLNTELKDLPKIKGAGRDLRYAMRSLLSLLHFDVANGDSTFRPVLAHIDELIGKVDSVAQRRETVAEKKATSSKEGEVDAADQGQMQDVACKPSEDGSANESCQRITEVSVLPMELRSENPVPHQAESGACKSEGMLKGSAILPESTISHQQE